MHPIKSILLEANNLATTEEFVPVEQQAIHAEWGILSDRNTVDLVGLKRLESEEIRYERYDTTRYRHRNYAHHIADFVAALYSQSREILDHDVAVGLLELGMDLAFEGKNYLRKVEHRAVEINMVHRWKFTQDRLTKLELQVSNEYARIK